MAEKFAEYFQSKVNNIRKDIDEEKKLCGEEEIDCGECQFTSGTFSEFHEITLRDLKTILGSMNKKFCSLDPILSWVIIECFDELGPIIIKIVNTLLSKGVFPSQFKTSVVKPTIKDRKGDLDELSNYRPVSNIPFLSKIIEKVVSTQLNSYLDKNELYCNKQSGYRKYHSCEILNVKMFDKILKDIDQGNIVALVLLDMSAAFDTVDHNILLNILKKCYGIDGKILSWFSTYLNDRKFSVKVYNHFSQLLNAVFGVPQGSILGPILFILYTKHLQHIATKYGLNIELYADDTQLYISFKHFDQHHCTDNISACLHEIKHWVCHKFLKLNEGKTKFLVLAKPSVQNSQTRSDQLILSTINTSITEVDWDDLGSEIKSLGVRLDENLNMSKHISYI